MQQKWERKKKSHLVEKVNVSSMKLTWMEKTTGDKQWQKEHCWSLPHNLSICVHTVQNSQEIIRSLRFKTTANMNSSEDTAYFGLYFKIVQFHINTNICYIHRQRHWTDLWGQPSTGWWGPARCLGYWKCRRRLCRWSLGGRSCWWCRMEVFSCPETPWRNSDTPESTWEGGKQSIHTCRFRKHTSCWEKAESHLAQDQWNHHSHEELRENGGEGDGGRRAKLEEQDQPEISSISLIIWYKQKSMNTIGTCKHYEYIYHINIDTDI